MTITALLSTLVAALMIAAPARAAAADDVQLRAEAGLAGLARPGRWLPIRVALENGRDRLAGDLVVEWGDARVRRAVTLAPGVRQQFELYVRTTNVQDIAIVRVETDGRAVLRAEIPLRIVRYDEPFITCIGPGGSTVADAPKCTATLAADSLPTSWRGYDATDEIVGPIDPRSIPADRERAIASWRTLRVLEDSSALSRPPAPEISGTVRSRLRAGLLAYLIAIPTLFLLMRRATESAALPTSAAVVVLVVAATGAAVAVGRGGPGSAVAVRATAIVHQFPGTGPSWVSMRGVAEYPDAARFDLRAPLVDGGFESTGARGTHDDQRYDDGGYPILSGRFALGAAKAFALEGIVDLPLVEVTPRASTIHVANASAFTLEDCSVRTGGTDRPLGALAPGAMLDVAGAPTGESLTLSCRAPAAALAFSEASHAVTTEGRMQLVVHLSGPHAS